MPEPNPITRARVVENYGKLPLRFEANQGQVDEAVQFLSRGQGYNLFLASTEAILVLGPASGAQSLETRNLGPQTSESRNVLRMKLVGANSEPKVVGLDALSGKSGYFKGSDPQKWYTQVPTYARVQYQDVYPGVDLIYYGNQQQLEYDFILAPGRDPGTIQFTFEENHD